MITVKIYHDNELKKTFTDQHSDACALGYLHMAQGNSADHAIRYEGWKVELTDQDTGEIEYWKPYNLIHKTNS